MDEAFAVLLQAVESHKALTPRTHEYLARLAAGMAPDVVKLRTAIHYGEQSKQVNVEFPDSLTKKWPCLELLAIGDVQFGHKDSKIAQKGPEARSLEYFVNWVLAEPWRFVFLTGDVIDAAHAFTPGSPFDNLFAAQSQVYRLCEIMGRIRHRIIGYVGGNHERRGIPVFGDLGVLLATILRIPYSDGRQYINITFGSHKPFSTMLWHGHPRARTKGALAQIMDRFMQIGNAKLYVTAHNHQSLVIPNFREISTPSGLRIEKFVGVSGTSFLETYGSYGEWMGFGAYDVLMPQAHVRRDGTWAVVVE